MKLPRTEDDLICGRMDQTLKNQKIFKHVSGPYLRPDACPHMFVLQALFRVNLPLILRGTVFFPEYYPMR
jgi:hypothetical protein